MKNYKNPRNAILTFSFLSILILHSQANAGGYSTKTYSTSGLANSYAGSTSGAHDISDSFFNPSVTAGNKKNETIFSLSYLNLKIDPDNMSGSNFSGSTNGRDLSNAGSQNLIPAFYISSPISDKLALNFALTSPFGLKTSYRADWTGRYRALNSSTKTLNFNPSIGYKLTDNFSIGAGLVAQYYETKLSALSIHPNILNNQVVEISGNDLGYGFNLGATYQIAENTKIGIGYRSKIVHNLKGNLGFPDLSSRFKAKTSTPETLSVGLSHNLSKNFQLVADSVWTKWSRLKQLKINAYDNSIFTSLSEFNWNDSFLNSLGFNYSLGTKNIIRAGFAYEKESVNNRNREPRIPTSNKYWLSAGLNHKFNNNFEIDLAYVRQIYEVNKIEINDMGNNNIPGTLHGKYKSSVDIISLALKKQF